MDAPQLTPAANEALLRAILLGIQGQLPELGLAIHKALKSVKDEPSAQAERWMGAEGIQLD